MVLKFRLTSIFILSFILTISIFIMSTTLSDHWKCSDNCPEVFTTEGGCQHHHRTCTLFLEQLGNASRHIASVPSSCPRKSTASLAVHRLKRRREGIGGQPKVNLLVIRSYLLLVLIFPSQNAGPQLRKSPDPRLMCLVP